LEGTVVPSAVPQARSRLGPEPFNELFNLTTEHFSYIKHRKDHHIE
jgi:hypothetical protein